jgi:beta-lactamase class C
VAYFVFSLYPVEKVGPPIVIRKKEYRKDLNPHLQQLLTDYEKSVKKVMRDAGTPGAAIAIVHDSTIIFMKGFGVRSVGNLAKVDTNTVFRIASVSKCFASMITGILVEDHILTWDDKIVQYLPDFCLKSPEQTSDLSIRHVLSHTTGLPYHTFTNMVEEGKDINLLLSKLQEVNLSGRVGEQYSYQNVAYSLIGEVIRSATGKTYEQQIIEQVFTPLRMKNASISYDAIIHNTNIAKPHHRQRKKGWVTGKITNTYYNVAPAGGINASISDMAHWMVALLGDREDVIKDSTLNEIFTPYVRARSKNRNYGRKHRLRDSFYAMGWRVLHYPNDTLIYHGGYVNGYRSEVAINRKDRIGICILANAPGALADTGIPVFFNMFLEEQAAIREWDRRAEKSKQIDSTTVAHR